MPTVHGFDEFFGNLYHLNAEEEPQNPDYPKDPQFRKRFVPRGVLKCKATDKDDTTVDPQFGKVGRQTIENTGSLDTKRMETVDEEFLAAALDFIERKTKEGKPWLCYFNPTRMHVWTHLKPESQGRTSLGTYPDGMVELDGYVGQLLKKLADLKLTGNTIVVFTTDNGAEVLSWPDGGSTPFRGGQTNADRYDLSKHVSSIAWWKQPDDPYAASSPSNHTHLKVVGPHPDYEGSERTLTDRLYSNATLPDVIGKELADRILGSADQRGEMRGLDLKVGGEGMRAFYDQMLPSIVSKLVKRYGAQVSHSAVPSVYANGDAVPVHAVDITPEFAAHVMRGQAVFEERGAYGSGESIPGGDDEDSETPAKRGDYELARSAIAAIPRSEFALWVRRLLDPANVSAESKATAVATRESLGELAHDTHEAIERLDRWSKQFDLLSPEDRLSFIDAIENGRAQPRRELQSAADVIRSMLDTWREQVRDLGVGALDNFIEDYFPHIWADPKAAKRAFAKVSDHRPLRGPATFLKQRKIPTMREGMALGLRPLTANPLIMAFLRIREMQRFVAGVKLMQKLRDQGLAVFLPSHKPIPEGWSEIKDAVGRLRQWSEQEQGFIDRGRYIMPEHAAQVINNHLSTSRLARVGPVQLIRGVSNAINALQLGFSAFHLGFTTLDAVISKSALAIERLLHGEPIGAARAVLEAATGPGAALANIRRGAKLLEAYSNISGATPEMRRIVEALIAGGGRVKIDNYYLAARGVSPFRGVGLRSLSQDIRAALTQPHHRVAELTKAVANFPGQHAMRLWRDLQSMAVEMPAWRLPLEVAGRVTRATSALIMEHIVPLQKLGVFADMAADHIRRHPADGPEEFARAMQSIWDSVDNRLGELVYDNLFWDRTWKDITHLAVRAVGWNLGTIREIGGAPVDAIRLIGYLARGAPIEGPKPLELGAPEGANGEQRGGTQGTRDQSKSEQAKWSRIADKVGHRIPYVIAMTATTAMLGAMLQYLLTGQGPQELKDYFFPRTGRLNPDGSPERISLPSYVKDIYEYWRHPGTTVANKANPLIGLVWDIWNNRDYYGDAIRNPDASLWEQTLESARFAAREVLPFSVQGAHKFQGAGEAGARGKALQAAPFIGVTPAPSAVTNPEQGERYDREHDQEAYLRGLTQHLRKAQRQGDQEQVRALRQEIQQERLRLRETERQIRQQRVHARADRIGAIIQGKSRAEAVLALRAAGYPAFAELWKSMPARLPERVVVALKTFDQRLSKGTTKGRQMATENSTADFDETVATVRQMSPSLAREVYALKARAELLNERLRVVHRALDILESEAVDLGAGCQKIAAAMEAECPAALPLVTPILDQIAAAVAQLTGRAH